MIKVNGIVQRYDNGRKKIEVKKEIKQIFDLFDDANFRYVMEHHYSIDKAINRIKEIYERTGKIPVLLNFEKFKEE